MNVRNPEKEKEQINRTHRFSDPANVKIFSWQRFGDKVVHPRRMRVRDEQLGRFLLAMTQLFPWDIFSKGMMDLLESEDGQLLDNYRYAIANTANAMSSKSLDDPMEGPLSLIHI